jgi:hypothetical protein
MTYSCAVRRSLTTAAAFAVALAAQPSQGQDRRPRVPDTGGRSATYDPLKTFAPFTMPQPSTVYRGGDGAPQPAYWQNSADYEMHASIDPATKVLSNIETITSTVGTRCPFWATSSTPSSATTTSM